MERIGIIGAGAIGSLLSARLFEAGFDVFLVDKHPDRSRKVNAQGLEIRDEAGSRKVMVPSHLGADGLDPPDLVIMAVKCRDTGTAAKEHEALVGGETMVLTLQNGLGNVETLVEAFGSERVLGGVTTMGANEVEPGVVHHAGDGLTVVGCPRGGDVSGARRVASIFEKAGMEAKAVDDLDSWLWRKVLVNAAINPLTALLGARNGVVASNSDLSDLVRKIVSEGLSAAAEAGVHIGLEAEQAISLVMDVARRTANNRSSMLMDRLKTKPTEIDGINGALARVGKAHGLDMCANETLVKLVKAMESLYASPERCET